MKYIQSIILMSYIILFSFHCSSYELIQYKDEDGKSFIDILITSEFEIVLGYLYQDDTYYNFEYRSSTHRNFLETDLYFDGSLKKKNFKLLELFSEVKAVNGEIIHFNKIIWNQATENRKSSIKKTFTSFEYFLENEITFNNKGVDNIDNSDLRTLGNIKIEYDVNKVPDDVIVNYRIKFIYDEVEYIKEGSVPVKKYYEEPQ